MATNRDTIINIITNDKDVDSTTAKLVKMGQVDEKNAQQFKKNNAKAQSERKKTLGILERERIKLKQIFDARERSNNPKAITRYNRLLDKQKNKIDKITGSVSKQSKQMGVLNGAIANIGAVMLASFSVGAIINFGKELKQLSIQMDADAKKNAIVFGASLDDVTKKAQENAHAIGLTTREYVRASASTQDLLVPLGFARKEAANMSTDLTNLSGALSVWSGGTRSATEVSEILTKTILGETEQIKTLGIKIDQTSPAFNQRIKQMMATNDLSLEQAKALEILNQITTKSVDAQESFANGQKTLAQEEATVNAKLREQKEVLADQLRPVWLSVTKEISTFIDNLTAGFGRLSEEFDNWVEGQKRGLEALGLLSVAVEKSKGETDEYSESWKQHRRILADAGVDYERIEKTVTLSTKTLGGMMQNLTKLRNEFQTVEVGSKRFNELKSEIDKTEKAIKKLTGQDKGKGATPEETIFGKLSKEAKKLKDELQEQALSGDISNDTMTKYLDLMKQLTQAQENLTTVTNEYRLARGEATAQELFDLELIEEKDTETLEVVNDNEEKRTQKARQEAQKRREIARQESQAQIQFGFNTVSQLSSLFQMYTNSRLIEIDNLLKEEEITEEEAQKRKAEVLTTQAERDKLFKSFEIITSTAQAVALAFATFPYPFSVGIAGLVGSLGAAQLSIVQNTPIPAFKDGTKGKVGSGLSHVGEKGEELVFLPHGAKVLPNEQTEKYSQIIDAMYDNRLDDFIMKNYLPRAIPQGKSKSQQNDDFIDKMVFGLGKEDFNSDAVVDTLKGISKKDDKRFQMLAGVIGQAISKRPNLRR